MSGICNNGAGFACIKESMEEMIKTNKEIEEEIRIEKKKMKNRIKILLLGCGEAGKSTFIKQMRIIHAEKNQSPWTDEQLKQYRSDVLRNCIQCIQILLNQNNEDLPVGYQNNASKLMELLAENPKDQDRLFQHSCS
ncbi:guanine nucleotide-binding protein G(q) subunit alpha [Eurytemora carolleeae]|uniref:guanine nucleotide-binding protein G(q) subunit alpha n=1 Tax=Eurytemora carolleeae TaxID=1294199 RepID=UPI000C77EF43|nr:guanine nucleotide-binding protein G(q) subunit alpha [Eurytemora carolleeae]|eukprot:XP_023325941.1 guanine nucleotide-binding protein G(q) subunit alpha-like [Eurytemora affinis]